MAYARRALSMRAYCRKHYHHYPMNVWRNNRVEGNYCDKCAEDKQWMVKARQQMEAEGAEITGFGILERAEAMAGYKLWRYRK